MARRLLMLPLVEAEHDAICSAFNECELCMNDLDKLSNPITRPWVETIQRTMGTNGLEGLAEREHWRLKVLSLSLDEKIKFSSAVDELADWLQSE